MSTAGKTKTNQQSALQANVPRIVAELHQLAAANARTAVGGRRASAACEPVLAIRGK